MATISRAEATTILRRLGWRVRTTGEYAGALKHFQAGWNLGKRLATDGQLGPITSAALRISEARRQKGLSTASAHFSFAEFACKCGGRYRDCARIWVRRELLAALEGLRKAEGSPIGVVSGCRCKGHNRAVRGASQSQHLFGGACDVSYRSGWTDSKVARYHLFSGLGRSARTHLVRHVDVRDKTGHNTTGGSPRRPTCWNYAS